MRFDKPFEFADGEPAVEADGTRKFPLKMRARGGQPLYHYWWGAVVHDMSGFKPDKPVIPVDWCHSDDLMGALDKFTPSDDGLDVEGFLASVEPKDRVDEVTKKSKAGIPYQASIFFVPLAIEDVAAGASAKVNGYEVDGPATIIRQWALRGVAVCPYGYDSQTNSQFANDDEGEIEVPLTHTAMSKTNTPPAAGTSNTDPNALNTDPNAPPADGNKKTDVVKDAAALAQKKLGDYITKFGAENGPKWFAEGKTPKQALELHVAALEAAQADSVTQLTAKDAEIAALKTRLDQAKPGELSAVTSTDTEPAKDKTPPAAPSKFAHLGEGLAKYAAGLKFPEK